jgi:FixJ family two-component response regulator
MNVPFPLVRIVDDDASFLTAVSRLLHASGFAVKTFTSSAEFLVQPEFDVPGCLILDFTDQYPETVLWHKYYMILAVPDRL